MNFKETTKKFFGTRTVGFWLAFAAAVIAVVEAIVYISVLGEDVERMSIASFVLVGFGKTDLLDKNGTLFGLSAVFLGIALFLSYRGSVRSARKRIFRQSQTDRRQ